MLTVTSPAQTGDLTVLAALKAELQVSGEDQDDYLTSLIRQASDAIARFCGRDTFGRETVVQTERVTCAARAIRLERDIQPVVASVVEDDLTLVDGTDYELDGALLYRLTGDDRTLWYARKVVITYSAGFELLSGLPYDLERACLDLCASLYHGRGRDRSLRSEKVLDVIERSWFAGDAGQSPAGLPPDIAGRLAQYRDLAIS